MKSYCIRALLTFITFFILVSWLSYFPNDNSFTVANEAPIKNLLGKPGAYSADLINAILGYNAITLILVVIHQAILSYTKRLKLGLFALDVMLLIGLQINFIHSTHPGILGLFWQQFSNLWVILAVNAFNAALVLYLTKGIFRHPTNNATSTELVTYPSLEEQLDSPISAAKAKKPKRGSALPSSPDTSVHANFPQNTKFSLPRRDILRGPGAKVEIRAEENHERAKLLEKTLKDFGVIGKVSNIRQGPVVSVFELEPAAGTKSSKIVSLAEDIARSLSALSARIAIIPGRNAMGIELPNSIREIVTLGELLEAPGYKDSSIKLPIILGKTIDGRPYVADLTKMPHLLIAGTTGSGKSVAINATILSLLYKLGPESCKFIMIDPKMLELSTYDNIPHLLSPVVTEAKKAVVALKWVVREMENRYKNMSMLGVRNIGGLNQKIVEAQKLGKNLENLIQTGFDEDSGDPIYERIVLKAELMPYIVVIVDEMADLMLVAGKEIESLIQRLAQMARAAGIHLILATQRPSVDVITGVIKANFPTRISFAVSSKIDSRTILGEQGAEQLLGMGDMLYMSGGASITRLHGPFVSDEEVLEVVSYLKKQAKPEYVADVTRSEDKDEEEEAMEEEGDESDLYSKALSIVLQDQRTSISYVQRQLRIGYNRAANLIERMEKEGYLSPPNHNGKRELLNK